MTERVTTTGDALPDRKPGVISGVLGDHVSRAVEILSVQNEISGSLAYQRLVQTAGDSNMSVREAARLLVEGPEDP